MCKCVDIFLKLRALVTAVSDDSLDDSCAFFVLGELEDTDKFSGSVGFHLLAGTDDLGARLVLAKRPRHRVQFLVPEIAFRRLIVVPLRPVLQGVLDVLRPITQPEILVRVQIRQDAGAGSDTSDTVAIPSPLVYSHLHYGFSSHLLASVVSFASAHCHSLFVFFLNLRRDSCYLIGCGRYQVTHNQQGRC